ncbi:hypothetical protein M0R19_03770 [Candidatus Pacearchaeota archaeon]|nr:hypothetical protein [Candidatus Pacearchaeota archaeon]
MILTGKMYKKCFYDNTNHIPLYFEIDKDWFYKNALPNIIACYNCDEDCNKYKEKEKDCLFLYSFDSKRFNCVHYPSTLQFKLIEKLDNI